MVAARGKSGALTRYRRGGLGAGQASWSHWKEHHLHSALGKAALRTAAI